MSDEKSKRGLPKLSIENHNTAAWANISKTKPVSRVTVPDEIQVDNAKEHVDSNQK